MSNINIWCIIIPLITAIIGWLLGRFISNRSEEETNINNSGDADRIAKLEADLEACKASKNSLSKDLDTCRTTKNNLSKDLDACRTSKEKLSGDLDACLASKVDVSSKVGNIAAAGLGFAASNSLADNSSSTSSAEPSLSFDASAAKLALGKKIIADDLKIVEGIGPKIAELFNTNGVKTWYQLSKTSVERCQEILDTGGKRYEIHNPSSWPKQSRLAFEGKWKELNDLQDYLDGGVEPK